MAYYLFSAQTVTAAQRMVQILQGCGISGQLQRMPSALARQGCGFAVRVPQEDGAEAYRCLTANHLLSKHIYLRENNAYHEVIL